jgi:hypothetical protein
MAKKTITVSDISGEVINPGEGVKVVITLNASGHKYVLDAHDHEIEHIFNAARRVAKRRTPKSGGMATHAENAVA